MKICPKCDSENRDDSKFCSNCSHDLQDVETEEQRIAREEKELEKQKKLEEEERELEVMRKKREEEEKQLELERKKREENERRKKERIAKLKKGTIVGLIIIIVLLIAGIFLLTGFGDSINQNSNNSMGLGDSNSNSGSVDEVITPQEDNVKMKNVEFNRLFKMYVPEDTNFGEFPPQSNSTYQWKDYNSDSSLRGGDIYYYDHISLNDIYSRLNAGYPGLEWSQEGNLIIFDGEGSCFVGVQSQDNEFVFIQSSHRYLDILKKSASTIVFE